MPSERYRKRMGLCLASGFVFGALWAAGCTSVIYDSNPHAPAGELGEKPDYASHTVQNLLATSIGWAVDRYPPPDDGNDGWFAINLPPGLTREQYIEVARQIGDRAAPMTPELGYLPTYHIGWVWMRGDRARVDVIRPVFALSGVGEPVYQAITLHLRRRYSSWRVERTQPWDPGVVPVPDPYYLPELPPEEQAALETEAEPTPEPLPAQEGEAAPEGAPGDAFDAFEQESGASPTPTEDEAGQDDAGQADEPGDDEPGADEPDDPPALP